MTDKEQNEALQSHLEILPKEQRALWKELKPLQGMGLVLYGGTAIALRLGHRVSIDFDFFSNNPLNKQQLWKLLPCLQKGILLQDEPQAITSLVKPTSEGGDLTVKLSMFCGLKLGRLAQPQLTQDGIALVASNEDLLASKLKVILQRAEAKDYIDIAALLSQALTSNAARTLAAGLSGASALYGSTFQPAEALKALVFLEDGDLGSLPLSTRQQLQTAVSQLGPLPPPPPVIPHLN